MGKRRSSSDRAGHRPANGWRVALTLLALAGLATTTPPPVRAHEDPNAAVPEIRAVRIEGELKVDGILDEAAWQDAPVADGFTQRNPNPGAPISQPTSFQVVYSATTLYIGIRADTDSPEDIVAREMQRDGPLFRDDALLVLLDTFHDHRNTYMFEANPLRARTDALIVDEGRSSDFQWDGLWEVGTSRNEDGWIAEFAIPFSTLRFDADRDTWGFQIRRIVRANNEFSFWSPTGLDANLFKTSRYGHLTGLEPPEPGLNLQVVPFVTGGVKDDAETGGSDDADAGLDVKWGITRNFVLDLTYNTDFAEVEADDLQVNLTRFSLFFPEKRDFFLENSGIFRFGPGAPTLDLFFSRRIGISPEGNMVPLEWGTRLSGRAKGWSLGFLDAQTEAATFEDEDGDREVVPSTNWGVLRVQRNFGQRVTVGTMVTNIETDDDDLGGDQRAWGLDANLNPTDRLNLTAFWAQTDDDDGDLAADEDGTWAAGVAADWRADTWNWELLAQEIRGGFEPKLGFVRRNGIRRYNGELGWQPRSDNPKILNYAYEAEIDMITRSDDSLESLELEFLLFGIELENANEVFFFAGHEVEDLDQPFEISDGVIIPAGRYEFEAVRGVWDTNSSLPLSGFVAVRVGEFFDGDRTGIEGTVRWRPNRFFRTETSYFYNDIELPAGDFSTTLLRQRAALAFTPDLSLNGLVQYSDAAELLGVNLRLRWTYRPGSDLFVVYNETWDAPSLGDPRERERQLIFKLSYLWGR
ncbi:MAG: DUF5916 domain-containing protein [Acidobacteriota bacterium]